MWNCTSRKTAIVENSQKTCCCWQVCERSGAKLKAIKSCVRGHAKHGGKLQERVQQQTCLQFNRQPPIPPPNSTFWLQLVDRQSQKTPLLRFSHSHLKPTGCRGEAVPEQEEPWDRYNRPKITLLSPPPALWPHILYATVYPLAKKQCSLALEVFTLRSSL